MCIFFSFVSDGNGNVFYFDAEDRKFRANPDSHTTIAVHFFKDAHADDRVNKYELILGRFKVDQINTKDDSKQVEKWIQSFSKTKHFYDICLEMVRQNQFLGNIPYKLRTTELCEIAIKQQKINVLMYVPDKYMTPELCELSVRQDGYTLESVPDKYMTPELCELAVREKGHALVCVPDKYMTPELCELAVRQNGYALKYVPEKMRTPELCELANL